MKKRIVFVASIFAVVVTGYLLLKVSGSVAKKKKMLVLWQGLGLSCTIIIISTVYLLLAGSLNLESNLSLPDSQMANLTLIS